MRTLLCGNASSRYNFTMCMLVEICIPHLKLYAAGDSVHGRPNLVWHFLYIELPSFSWYRRICWARAEYEELSDVPPCHCM